jgi:hypothetical protein
MISAEVIKGVQELLEACGIHQRPNENFGDFVARGLGISAHQAEVLLEALHDGHTVEESARIAGIDPKTCRGDLLNQIARAIGSGLGRLVR